MRFFNQFMIQIPIRSINFVTPNEQREYYKQKARLLYQQCVSKDDQQCVLGFVEHHLGKEPEASDVVHDLLAMLAEEMLRLNKEKRAQQQEFLDWLVAYLRIQPQPDPKDGKVGLDAMKKKGELLNYPGDYQKGAQALTPDGLHAILLENKKRFMEPWSERLWPEIEQRYQESLNRVLPLKEQLSKTDALIDQVVYKLYGLTEEEIQVVEGKVDHE